MNRIKSIRAQAVKTIPNCNINATNFTGQPFFVKSGEKEFLYPLKNGTILLRNNEKVDVFCTEFFNITKKEMLTIKCTTEGLKIQGVKNTIDPKLLECSTQVEYIIKPKEFKCFKESKIYEVGFQLSKNWFPLYSSCYDDVNYNILYVEHTVEQETSQIKKKKKADDPVFQQFDFFNGVNMYNIYLYENLVNVYEYYGLDTRDIEPNDKFISKGEFKNSLKNPNYSIFLKGHLAANADFVYKQQKNATYTV